LGEGGLKKGENKTVRLTLHRSTKKRKASLVRINGGSREKGYTGRTKDPLQGERKFYPVRRNFQKEQFQKQKTAPLRRPPEGNHGNIEKTTANGTYFG